MEPWFRQFPRRLDDEIHALREAGYEFHPDEAAQETGQIVITVKYPLDGVVHDLVVYFPENYPYFPFEIMSPSFPGGRHKNPCGGQLCLLKDPQQNWQVTDTLAGFLRTQVALVAEAHRKPENAKEIEAHEASQVTGYYQYLPGTVVFTGKWEMPKEYDRGYLLLGLTDGVNPNTGLRSAVLEIRDDKQSILLKIDECLSGRYQKTTTGRWIRLPSPPPFDVHAALAHAAKAWPDLTTPRFNGAPDVVGLLFPEEVEYERFHENWVFLVRQKVRDTKRRGQTHVVPYFARSEQASLSSLQARVPNLSPISSKKVLVVGLGSIGSIFAWQMARAGIGGIHMIDFDHMQLGNAPRWLLGWQAVGFDKAGALRHYLSEQYPFVTVKSWQHRIGAPKFSSNHPGDFDILPEALEGVDLIFDATAEWCVSHFLSDLAQKRGIPYVWATGTPGAWGGTIGRVVPGRTAGCWKCYQRKLTDGTFRLPSQAPVPDIQPVGCFHPTFTGTGFDMDHVTLAAVRLAISTLCAGENPGYPDFGWDVGIIDTWNNQGMPISPNWETYKLERHSECNAHE